MNAIRTLDLSFVNQESDGSMTFNAALITPECLPVYFLMVIYKGKVEHTQGIDTYSPGATQTLVELVEAYDDGSAEYTTTLIDSHLATPLSLVLSVSQGNIDLVA